MHPHTHPTLTPLMMISIKFNDTETFELDTQNLPLSTDFDTLQEFIADNDLPPTEAAKIATAYSAHQPESLRLLHAALKATLFNEHEHLKLQILLLARLISSTPLPQAEINSTLRSAEDALPAGSEYKRVLDTLKGYFMFRKRNYDTALFLFRSGGDLRGVNLCCLEMGRSEEALGGEGVIRGVALYNSGRVEEAAEVFEREGALCYLHRIRGVDGSGVGDAGGTVDGSEVCGTVDGSGVGGTVDAPDAADAYNTASHTTPHTTPHTTSTHPHNGFQPDTLLAQAEALISKTHFNEALLILTPLLKQPKDLSSDAAYLIAKIHHLQGNLKAAEDMYRVSLPNPLSEYILSRLTRNPNLSTVVRQQYYKLLACTTKEYRENYRYFEAGPFKDAAALFLEEGGAEKARRYLKVLGSGLIEECVVLSNLAFFIGKAYFEGAEVEDLLDAANGRGGGARGGGSGDKEGGNTGSDINTGNTGNNSLNTHPIHTPNTTPTPNTTLRIAETQVRLLRTALSCAPQCYASPIRYNTAIALSKVSPTQAAALLEDLLTTTQHPEYLLTLGAVLSNPDIFKDPSLINNSVLSGLPMVAHSLRSHNLVMAKKGFERVLDRQDSLFSELSLGAVCVELYVKEKRKGYLERAVKVLRRAVQRSPYAAVGLCVCLLLDEEENGCEEVLRVLKDLTLTRHRHIQQLSTHNMGVCLLKMGRTEEALKVLLKTELSMETAVELCKAVSSEECYEQVIAKLGEGKEKEELRYRLAVLRLGRNVEGYEGVYEKEYAEEVAKRRRVMQEEEEERERKRVLIQEYRTRRPK